MSRSILKCSEKRVVPIQANEGSDGDRQLGAVRPWGPIDDEPMMMKDVHNEMEKIQTNLQKMHQKMMTNFPHGPGVFPPHHEPFNAMLPPPPPLQPLPFPHPPGPADAQGHLAITGGPGHGQLTPTVNGDGRHNGSSSPYGSLRKQHGAVVLPPEPGPLSMVQKPGPLSMVTAGIHGGFHPPNMMMVPPPAMPPMPLVAPGPSPVIREDESGYKMMELVLDVKGYMPDDIHINTEGNILYVHACRLAAKHDVRGEGNVHDARVAKECRRQYTLPEVVRAENLRCYVNRKGELTIEGPLGPDVIRTLTKKKVKFAAGNK